MQAKRPLYTLVYILLSVIAAAQTGKPNTTWSPTTTVTDQTANNMATCTATHASYVGTTSCQYTGYPGEAQPPWPIASISRSGTTVTVTINAGTYQWTSGDKVVISGVTDAADFPSGTYTTTGLPSSTTLTYTQSGAAVSSSGGTATRGVLTQQFDATPGNVANIYDGVDLHTMVYRYTGGTAATRIMFHTMPWFACGSTACAYSGKPNIITYASHTATGYVSDSLAQVEAQVKAMNRYCGGGPCGIFADWQGIPYTGSSSNRLHSSHFMQNVHSAIDAVLAGTDFYMSMVLDDAGWKTSTLCGYPDVTSPSCVEKVIIDSMEYVHQPKGTAYTALWDGQVYTADGAFNDPQYVTVAGGRPLVATFVNEGPNFNNCVPAGSCAIYNNGAGGTCGGATTATASSNCWSAVWTGVCNHIASWAHPPAFVFRNTWSKSPACINSGSMRWHNPNGVETNYDLAGYDSWITTAKTSSLVVLAMGAKGDDHAQSSFQNDNIVMNQQCGMTLMTTMSEPNKGSPAPFSLTHPLGLMQMITWNDHEQGTTLENGLDSCYGVTASLANGIVSWTLTTSDTAQAPLSPLNPTLHHMAVYAAQDGTNVQRIKDNIAPTATGTLDLRQLALPPGTYTIYVKMVPQAAMQTRWATAGTYTQTSVVVHPKVM